MQVRAKFVVESKTKRKGGYFSVQLNPVIGSSEENKAFYMWTPGGSIVLDVVNPKVFEGFEVGKEYYVDFTPAG